MTTKLVFGWAAVLLLAACATVPSDPIARAAYDQANDPIEPLNRAVFAFNLKVDDYVLEPAARGYRRATTPGLRIAVHNFLHNLRTPVTLANDLLQANLPAAAQTSWDFVMNSTVGMLGFFDVTDDAEWEPHEEDFGQTLAVWKVHEGPYLVLPLLGPSNVRDTVGLVADRRAIDPLNCVLDRPEAMRLFLGTAVVGAVDARERSLESLANLRRTSLDFYVTARSLYRQARNNQIRNGAPAPFDEYNFE